MSQKAKDDKNRWRNKTVGFRMSLAETERLNMLVATSGMSKQDYLIKRVLQQEITIIPNPIMKKGIRVYLERIYDELCRINSIDSHSDILETINYITLLINDMSTNENKEKSSFPARKEL